ncbi:uncharacterized protein LOC131941650 [Physella acuta]|uniref:uncharacterized protein LOC131941650 n=1 Tax=Physella acuta TaxID=109671 RepID=UPI0027DB0ECA|nr:uncharacterized protein LOC131941650 [Physella acuta]XP_059157013.1 uncharacterized protein LOC131941650 [Physella acuta]
MWRSIEFKVFAVLMFAVGVWSDCHEADWSDSFNKFGLFECDHIGDFLQGFCRTDPTQSNAKNGGLGKAVCCTKPPQWTGSADFRLADWWSSFSTANASVECPPGYFLTGLYKSEAGWKLSSIKEGRCTKAQDQPPRYEPCYDEDVSACFDKTGCCSCRKDTYITGLYRGECNDLRCLTKLRCCAVLQAV